MLQAAKGPLVDVTKYICKYKQKQNYMRQVSPEIRSTASK